MQIIKPVSQACVGLRKKMVILSRSNFLRRGNRLHIGNLKVNGWILLTSRGRPAPVKSLSQYISSQSNDLDGSLRDSFRHVSTQDLHGSNYAVVTIRQVPLLSRVQFSNWRHLSPSWYTDVQISGISGPHCQLQAVTGSEPTVRPVRVSRCDCCRYCCCSGSPIRETRRTARNQQ